MTAKASIQDAVKAMREGAFDYLTKPFVEIEECVNRVRQAARLKRLHDENQALRDQVDASPTGALVDSVALR
jgi:DNA-binding NtrC family response regulator